MRNSIACIALMACGLLTGCGNPEPSSKDIQSALQKYMLGPESKVVDAEYISLDANDIYRQFLTAEKVACTRSDNAPGSVCDFQINMCLAKANEKCEAQPQTASGRFTKTNKGWAYIPTTPTAALPRPVDMIDDILNADIMASGGIAGRQ